jgi:hypothetical protein
VALRSCCPFLLFLRGRPCVVVPAWLSLRGSPFVLFLRDCSCGTHLHGHFPEGGSRAQASCGRGPARERLDGHGTGERQPGVSPVHGARTGSVTYRQTLDPRLRGDDSVGVESGSASLRGCPCVALRSCCPFVAVPAWLFLRNPPPRSFPRRRLQGSSATRSPPRWNGSVARHRGSPGRGRFGTEHPDRVGDVPAHPWIPASTVLPDPGIAPVSLLRTAIRFPAEAAPLFRAGGAAASSRWSRAARTAGCRPERRITLPRPTRTAPRGGAKEPTEHPLDRHEVALPHRVQHEAPGRLHR